MGLLQVFIYWFLLGLAAMFVSYLSLDFSYHRIIFRTSFIVVCQLVWNFIKGLKTMRISWKYIWNFWLHFFLKQLWWTTYKCLKSKSPKVSQTGKGTVNGRGAIPSGTPKGSLRLLESIMGILGDFGNKGRERWKDKTKQNKNSTTSCIGEGGQSLRHGRELTSSISQLSKVREELWKDSHEDVFINVQHWAEHLWELI